MNDLDCSIGCQLPILRVDMLPKRVILGVVLTSLPPRNPIQPILWQDKHSKFIWNDHLPWSKKNRQTDKKIFICKFFSRKIVKNLQKTQTAIKNLYHSGRHSKPSNLRHYKATPTFYFRALRNLPAKNVVCLAILTGIISRLLINQNIPLFKL